MKFSKMKSYASLMKIALVDILAMLGLKGILGGY